MSLALFAALLCIVSRGSIAQDGDHTYTSQSIGIGYAVYVQQCALCHGPSGGRVAPINLSRGVFRNSVTDDDLRRVISQGASQGRMPGFNLGAREVDGLIALIRTGFDPEGQSVRIGNQEQGGRLFADQCASCHRVNGQGPRTAPDLSDIALIRTPAHLQRTITDPSAALMPINRRVTIVTRDEETISGRRLNEDTYTVQLIDSNERLRSLIKADLISYDISDTPTHKLMKISEGEVADLVAYLLSMRGTL
jgi:putative heme-binding domain-containing protein